MAYSKKEKLVADLMSYLPWLKPLVKRTYQHINFLLNKPSSSFETSYKLHELGETNKESFFGYYDKSPLNINGEYAIYQQTTHTTTQKPSAEKAIEVVLFHMPTQKMMKSWPTHAYNWQQGAKPMWLDDQRFSFNYFDTEQNSYGAQIIDISETHLSKILKTPLYDAQANTGLSLSFERLNEIMPDYGYRNLNNPKSFSYSEEGIIKVNLKSNESKLLISIQQIIDLHPQKTMENAVHWFNHIQLAPHGDRFIFLHRWIQKGKKYDALILSDIQGKNIKVLANDGMVSHCFWKSEKEIISYMRNKKWGDKYYIIDISNNQQTALGDDSWDRLGDGHPHTFENLMLFDTYPNRARMKELYLYNSNSKEKKLLGAFLEPMKYFGETRCDLHPRFSKDGKKIFFDSVHTGRRRLYYIDLEEDQ